MSKIQLDEQTSLIAENFMMKEDHGPKLTMGMIKALAGFEDWRLKVKDIVFKEYPKSKKDFIKAMSEVDSAMEKVENFLETI